MKQSFAEYVSRQLPGMLKAGRRVNMKNIINSLSRLTRMDVQEYVNQHLQASSECNTSYSCSPVYANKQALSSLSHAFDSA